MERGKVEIGPEILLPIGPVKTRTLLRAHPRQRDRDPMRKVFSSVVKHSDSRLLIELIAADSSGSFWAFSSRRPAFGCTLS
jgi:hypothetical protein